MKLHFLKHKLKVLHFAPESALMNQFKKLKNLSYDTIDLNSPIADIKLIYVIYHF